MMVVRFAKDFDWCVGNTIIAYRAGHHVSVTADCAETAIEGGFAEPDIEVDYPEEDDSE